jgi:hypothetical protein
LKLRATDLENIVDDLSDGEGDEEEGDRQRLLEEARQDRLKTKKILEALANGQKGAGRQSNTELRNRGLYGLDELVAGDFADLAKAQKEGAQEGEGDEGALDFDDDEELQAKYLNQMRSRIRGQKDETAMDELSDEDENEESNDEEGLTALTPEERAQRAKIAAIEKENYRRYFEQALRNRALRMSSKQQEEPVLQPPRPPQLTLVGSSSGSQLLRSASVTEELGTAPPLTRPSSSSAIFPPPLSAPARDGGELKRRVSMPPRKVCLASAPLPHPRIRLTATMGKFAECVRRLEQPVRLQGESHPLLRAISLACSTRTSWTPATGSSWASLSRSDDA